MSDAPVTEINGAQIVTRIHEAGEAVAILNKDPLVFTHDGFVHDDECAHIIELASGRMKRAEVAGDKSGVLSDGRTNSVLWVRHEETPVLKGLADRIAALLGVPLAHAEAYQVIHYGPGAQYKAHFDAFSALMERGKRNLARGGQRIMTVLCYLNTVEVGGATGFPKLDVTIEARKGRLIGFNNCPGSSVERSPLSLHAGQPVEVGEKWAFNLWFRQYPAHHKVEIAEARPIFQPGA